MLTKASRQSLSKKKVILETNKGAREKRTAALTHIRRRRRKSGEQKGREMDESERRENGKRYVQIHTSVYMCVLSRLCRLKDCEGVLRRSSWPGNPDSRRVTVCHCTVRLRGKKVRTGNDILWF